MVNTPDPARLDVAKRVGRTTARVQDSCPQLLASARNNTVLNFGSLSTIRLSPEGAESISGRRPVRPFRNEVDLYQGVVREACDTHASAGGQTTFREEAAINVVHRLIILLEAGEVDARHYDVFKIEAQTGKDRS